MLEYTFPFPYVPDRASPHLFKLVLALLSLTLHLVYPLISPVLPLFSVIRVLLESSSNK